MEPITGPVEIQVGMKGPVCVHYVGLTRFPEATPAQVALAWVQHQGVVAIPKAASAEHVRQNREAWISRSRNAT